MRWVKCIDPQGKVDVIRGKAKAAEYITAATKYAWSEYYIQQAADNGKDIAGFRFSWATPEEVQQHRASTVTDTVEELIRAGDMQQDGAISVLNAPTRDRLADGFRSFGIGVTVMDRHDTPVPHGYFYATAMLQHAGKLPGNYLTSPVTVSVIEMLTKQLCLTHDKVVPTFTQGPYKGTWVHRDLATNLAMYCDRTGALQLAVSQAIRALADRIPVPAAPPSVVVEAAVPLSDQEKALGIMHVAAAEEKAFAVKVKLAELKERELAVARKLSELERSHLKEIGAIKLSNNERQAAAKRKQQEESAAQAKKHAKREAERQAAKDKQAQLRAQAHRNPASKLAAGSTLMSATFPMRSAVNKAARDMGVAETLVVKFMKEKQGNKTGYQKILEGERLVKGGIQLATNKKYGYYERGVYPMSKFGVAVEWIKKNYKDVTPRIHLPMGNPPRSR